MGTMKIKLCGHKNLSAVVDEEDYRNLNLGAYKWYPMSGKTLSTRYAFARKNKKTIYLHRVIMGLQDAPKSVFVDHIDHNGLNNSRTNLRITNNSDNQRNARKRISAKNTSTYKGVHRGNGKIRPWKATLSLSLGSYKTEIEAAHAYNEAILKIFGKNAFLNVLPDEK